MTDEVENLVLEHLRAIRADVADVRRDVRDIKTRLSSLENQVVQMHKSVAFIHEDLAGVNVRLDSLGRPRRTHRRQAEPSRIGLMFPGFCG